MTVFYLTFGDKYAREPHPVLGARPDLPNGWLTVTAPTMGEARAKVADLIGDAWCDVYDPDDMRTDYYPAGNLGPIEDAVAGYCECFELDPKYHTTHYGATDPATTHEWNPDCPVHRPYTPSEKSGQ